MRKDTEQHLVLVGEKNGWCGLLKREHYPHVVFGGLI